MRRHAIPVTPFAQNCSLVWCGKTGRGALVDPGGEEERLLAAAAARGVTVEKILLTHGHLDHAGAAGTLSARLNAPVEGPHRGDAFWLRALSEQAARFGLPAPARPVTPDRWLDDGDVVAVGDATLSVLHCPGHTPGHVVFHDAVAGVAYVGDVLFRGGVGRTDFPGGSRAALIRSIRERLWPLGDGTVFVPGHGPASTFGAERADNPFVADRLFS